MLLTVGLQVSILETNNLAINCASNSIQYFSGLFKFILPSRIFYVMVTLQL